MLFQQSEATAAQRRWFFHCVDDSDGTTPETGLTFSGTELQISENGAAFADFLGAATELSDGLYYYEATAAELSTVGALAFKIEKTGVRTTILAVGQVVPWDPYAVLNLGLTALPAVAAEAAGGLITSGTSTGQLNVAGGRADADVAYWDGTVVVTPTTAGVPRVDVKAMEADTITAAAIATDAATELVAAFMAFSHDTGLTIKGAFRRLDALVAGKATGLRSAVASYFMRDGTTEAIEAVQDSLQGTRAAADVTGSEA
jgi:hypothetical protein